MRTVQAVRERSSRRWRRRSSAIATCSASRSGASGAVVQVFIVRGGRVIERVEFVWDARRPQGTDGSSGRTRAAKPEPE